MFRNARPWAILRSAALALALLSMAGCLGRKSNSQPVVAEPRQPDGRTNLAITPIPSAVARVVSVNAAAKFAVLSFPVGQLPAVDTRLSVFHEGRKSGELKVSGPQEDTFTVGDITAGSVQVGDEVRLE